MKNVLFYRGIIGPVIFPSACSKTIRQLSRNVRTYARPIIWLQIKRIVIFVAPKQNDGGQQSDRYATFQIHFPDKR